MVNKKGATGCLGHLCLGVKTTTNPWVYTLGNKRDSGKKRSLEDVSRIPH